MHKPIYFIAFYKENLVASGSQTEFTEKHLHGTCIMWVHKSFRGWQNFYSF